MSAPLQPRDFERKPPTTLCAGVALRLRRGMRAVTRVSAICGLVLCASMSCAWDGAVSGTIGIIEVTAGSNQAFRLFLNGVGAHCSGGATWGFLNDTDSNYKTYVATLLMARSMNKTVSLFMTNEGGYCHIGHMMVLN